MDRPARPQTGQEPPEGEYVVFHERPYPKRLDRAFRIIAIVMAVATLAGIEWALLATTPKASADFTGTVVAGILALVVAALAYGLTRAIGLIVVGLYGGTRRKAYVVDWEESPPSG